MDWLPGLDLAHLFNAIAQTTPPAPPSPNEAELLKSQLALLEKAYANLDKTFARYIGLVQAALAVGGIAVSTVVAVGVWLFRDSLMAYRKMLKDINQQIDIALKGNIEREVAAAMRQQQDTIQAEVQQRVQTEIGLTVRRRIDRLEQMIEREDIPSQVSVDYVVPTSKNRTEAEKLNFALRVLRARGFDVSERYVPEFQDDKQTDMLSSLDSADIVLLDLNSPRIPSEEWNTIISRLIPKISQRQTALVVYVPSNQTNIFEFQKKGYYCSAANNLLSLVPRTIEAAYVVGAIAS